MAARRATGYNLICYIATYPIDISHPDAHIPSMNAPSHFGRIASLFRSNRSQAVRIPKDMEFPESVKKLIVRKVGKELIFTPPENLWDDFFDEPGVDLGSRDQPSPQERDFGF